MISRTNYSTMMGLTSLYFRLGSSLRSLYRVIREFLGEMMGGERTSSVKPVEAFSGCSRWIKVANLLNAIDSLSVFQS